MDLKSSDLNQHISSQFNEDLESLRTHVLKMAGMVERNLRDALIVLETMESGLLPSIEQAEHQINAFEVAVDREVISIIALRQPAASDLRVVMAISKIVRDLERMGDEAYKIGKLATDLAGDPPPAMALNLSVSLGRQVAELVKRAVDSFVRLDADQAREVGVEDRNIDADYESALRAVSTFMIEDPRAIGRLVKLLWIFRALERIGDHATNVSEQLIYAVRGKDVRHADVTESQIEDIVENRE
ncbi:phosphate signaling complex protein PhoU [Litorivicinus lipolyticus]|uniref:Phosphate-specific transport system accessory protein PhoU n=1 Tax=Litorivicinus lipolyticus TaxID=418701 RepID=A0A5Q2Q848_9GAMM|nr:phosphate signaling complex protein PhoU [Litorivicinus lipolyticus]QGG79193.1 phosphate signaling complex protein PhoU [Litorivicinus lipolyticus]